MALHGFPHRHPRVKTRFGAGVKGVPCYRLREADTEVLAPAGGKAH